MKRLVGIGLVGWALSPGSSINAPATSSLVFQGSTGLRTHGWSWALDPARNELYTTDWMLTSPDYGKVRVLDVLAGSVDRVLPTTMPWYALEIDSARQRLYALSGADIYVIDADSGAIIETQSVPGVLSDHLVLNPLNGEVFLFGHNT